LELEAFALQDLRCKGLRASIESQGTLLSASQKAGIWDMEPWLQKFAPEKKTRNESELFSPPFFGGVTV